ncbi:MAG: bifunctional isocitrate dehydrogenase kinase/phosphatase [Sandaracinaceae bacterium]|nr:bifunctional isocitrate dehydrogenase kinase/phosphatase [Sandaracinaceae bacterium]
MTTRPLTPSRLAAPVASAILEAFSQHREGFLATTRRAHESFAKKDWARLKSDQVARLRLYRSAVDTAEMRIRVLLGERCRDRLVWVSAKAVYSALIGMREDWDVAETFFNGVTRRIFDTVGVDPLIEFVASDFDGPPVEVAADSYKRFAGGSPRQLVLRCLEGFDLGVRWARPIEDTRLIAKRLKDRTAAMARGVLVALEVLEQPFYRGTGAYLVGRAVLPGGAVFPVIFAIRHCPGGIYVDALLDTEDDASMLFGFTRSYFQVETPCPYEVMRFLRSLIPKKRIAEIYIAIGEPKQGKTELYRAVMDHIGETADTFGYAPGVPGLVMVVFTMPGLDVVLKVIRDKFPPEKQTTPELVRDRYRWVYDHDRAGRLVDAQEFEHLAFPRDRFEPALLEELLGDCGETVRVDGDRVIVDLAYVTRQVTPLNIYVRTEPQPKAEAALAEWGEAIRDLARENIFPGDLLLKNFGVTRHGRVALYDYDELAPMTEVAFRDLPETDDDEDEMRAEPWYSVGPYDVFPQEFPRFLGLPGRLRPSVLESCADIFDAGWWREVQAGIVAGDIAEQPPYDAARKLRRA